MTKCSVCIVAALLALGLSEPGYSQGSHQKNKQIQHKLECQFTMSRSLAVLKDKISSTGKLYLGGPGLLRFETHSPTRSTLVVNQGQAWMHYPDLGITKNFDLSQDPAMRVLSVHLVAMTSGDLSSLKHAYNIVARSTRSMELVPKQAAVRAMFQSIRVDLGPRDTVSVVELRSKGGDLTTIQFQNVKIRQSLPAKLFSNPGSQ